MSRPSRPRPCSAATPTGAGPVWFPLNYLVIAMLERYHQFYGRDFEIEYPTGSGERLTHGLIVADLRDRLISLFTTDANGRRP